MGWSWIRGRSPRGLQKRGWPLFKSGVQGKGGHVFEREHNCDYGDGRDGILVVGSSESRELEDRDYQFSGIDIALGGTVTFPQHSGVTDRTILCCGHAIINGTIHVDERGLQGGVGDTDGGQAGTGGFDSAAPGAGGGGASATNAGGAGGDSADRYGPAAGGAGGAVASDGDVGASLGIGANPMHPAPGSGGGSGGGDGTNAGGDGGRGGGALTLNLLTVVLGPSSRISANGGNGTAGTGNAGGGGGGGGGSIVLCTEDLLRHPGSVVEALGGDPGAAGSGAGAGGTGGTGGTTINATNLNYADAPYFVMQFSGAFGTTPSSDGNYFEIASNPDVDATTARASGPYLQVHPTFNGPVLDYNAEARIPPGLVKGNRIVGYSVIRNVSSNGCDIEITGVKNGVETVLKEINVGSVGRLEGVLDIDLDPWAWIAARAKVGSSNLGDCRLNLLINAPGSNGYSVALGRHGIASGSYIAMPADTTATSPNLRHRFVVPPGGSGYVRVYLQTETGASDTQLDLEEAGGAITTGKTPDVTKSSPPVAGTFLAYHFDDFVNDGDDLRIKYNGTGTNPGNLSGFMVISKTPGGLNCGVLYHWMGDLAGTTAKERWLCQGREVSDPSTGFSGSDRRLPGLAGRIKYLHHQHQVDPGTIHIIADRTGNNPLTGLRYNLVESAAAETWLGGGLVIEGETIECGGSAGNMADTRVIMMLVT